LCSPKHAVIQRVCAVRADKSSAPLAAVPAPSGG